MLPTENSASGFVLVEECAMTVEHNAPSENQVGPVGCHLFFSAILYKSSNRSPPQSVDVWRVVSCLEDL
jgi:hypothetical protein